MKRRLAISAIALASLTLAACSTSQNEQPTDVASSASSNDAFSDYEEAQAALDSWWSKIPGPYRAKACELFDAFPETSLQGYLDQLTPEQRRQLLPESYKATMSINCINY